MNRFLFIRNAKSLRKKILFSFFIFILLIWIYSTGGVLQLKQLMKSTDEIVNSKVEMVQLTNDLLQTVEVRSIVVHNYLLSGTEAYRDLFREYSQRAVDASEALKQYDDYTEIAEGVELGINWNKTIEAEVISLYESGDAEGALDKLNSLTETALELHTIYKSFADKKNEEINTDGTEIIHQMQLLRTALTVAGYLITIIIMIITLYLSKDISKPINKVMNRIEAITKGELDHEPLELTAKDETKRLADSVNTMSDQMALIIGKIKTESNSIASDSNNLREASEQITSDISLTSEAIEQIADGADEQAVSTAQLRTLMQDFMSNVQSANDNSLKVQSHSQSVQEMTTKGQDLINETEEQIYKIDSIVKEVANRVEGLNNKTREITKLVEVITDIADQTNLLALNAAIEAARAGEQGKGFAVVADEVRKLADQVSQSVSNISTIVQTIQDETNHVTQSLIEGYKEVEKGSQQTNNASRSYREISSAVNEMVTNINSVSTNLQNIADSTTSIDLAIENIAAVSEQSAASSQQTSAAIQEVSSSMDSIADAAKNLSKTANELQHIVTGFKL